MHSSNLNKHFGKQSVDYDDTDFLQKMFSNENELRGLNKGSVHQTSLNTLQHRTSINSKKLKHEDSLKNIK